MNPHISFYLHDSPIRDIALYRQVVVLYRNEVGQSRVCSRIVDRRFGESMESVREEVRGYVHVGAYMLECFSACES